LLIFRKTIHLILFDRTVRLNVFANNFLHTFTDLHMEFDILMHRKSKPNQAKITVYNLSEKSRKLFNEKHQAIEFFAGYDNKPLTIFRGTTTNVLSIKNNVEWRTDFYAGEGQKEFSTIKFSKTYKAGIPISLILTEVSAAIGLPVVLGATGLDELLLSSVTYDGLAKDVLDQITDDYFLNWSIHHGFLEIVDAGEPPATAAKVIVLRSDTGLLESPTITEDGINVVAMLNPEIKPSAIIKIEPQQTITQLGKLMEKKIPSKSAEGLYIVDRAHFIGNNFGGRFDVEIESKIRNVA